jgi:hypothetical protein
LATYYFTTYRLLLGYSYHLIIKKVYGFHKGEIANPKQIN